MDDRPIGIFDSGVGGLTAINAFTEVLPNESIIYFGDTARAPYGSKSAKTVRAFTAEISDFLIKRGVKMLVAACNTSSSIAIGDISKAHPELPVQGIIKPCAAKIAAECGAEDHIGVIATPVTVQSKAYEKEVLSLNPSLDIHAIACPAFVPLIESGSLEGRIIDAAVAEALDGFIKEYSVNTLVLGCTHYPLIRGVIERLYPGLKIIDPSRALAEHTKKILEEKDMLASDWPGDCIFYASDLSTKFLGIINLLEINRDYELKQQRL